MFNIMTQQRVLFVSPEVYPFAKFTSMSELCAGLPKFIKEYGHEIRVVMPKYKFINDSKYVLRDVIRLKEVPVEINGEKHVACVKSSFVPDSKIQIYFVEIDGFYKYDSFEDEDGNFRPGILKELAFFSKACLELLKILHWTPEVIHSNDWQSALVHYYLKNEYKDDEFFQGAKRVFSLHNLDQVGEFNDDDFAEAGLDSSQFDRNHLLRFLLEDTQVLTLNNEESLMEYEENDYFSDFVEKKRLEIIPHGYDDLVWNPQAKKMKQVYNYETIDQKDINKKYLTHKKDLDLIENAPVITIHVDRDYEYMEELESWLERQEEKDVFILMTSLERDVNKVMEEKDIFGDNFIYLKSATNDELKNYIAASEFYINLCNRGYYNQRFGISVPFGTIPCGQRGIVMDQFVSIEEDEENFNSVLVDNIRDDFDALIDKTISIYKSMNMIEIQKRIISMLISWNPSGMRVGKIYDSLD